MMSSLNIFQAVLLSIILYLSVIQAINVAEFNSKITRIPSLYEQSCCDENNRDKAVVIKTVKKRSYFFCPFEIPSSCNDYFTSCSAMLTLFPAATSGYYNITPCIHNQ